MKLQSILFLSLFLMLHSISTSSSNKDSSPTKAIESAAKVTESKHHIAVFEALADLKKLEVYPKYDAGASYSDILKDLKSRGVKITFRDKTRISIQDKAVHYPKSYAFKNGKYAPPKIGTLITRPVYLNGKVVSCLNVVNSAPCNVQQKEYLSNSLKRADHILSALFNRHKRKHPKDEGTIVFGLTILAQGKAEKVEVIRSVFQSDALFQRLVASLRRLDFEDAKLGKVRVEYSVCFKGSSNTCTTTAK